MTTQTPVAETTLRGSVGGHPGCADPLVACSALWRARTGVAVVWDNAPPRSHDLLVIGHPRVGELVRDGSLLPLNSGDRVRELTRLAGQSVGESFTSYRMQGEQWALPIEASAHVQAWRADRMDGPALTWVDVLALARRGRVLLPMRPPHSLLLLFTLAANLGQPCGMTGEAELNDPVFGADVLGRIRTLMAHLDPACYDMDPAQVYQRLARPDAVEYCAPCIEGDLRYARPGTDTARLAFTGIAAAGRQGPVGATLAGAGIAVSSRTASPEAAVAFAFWLASGEVQRDAYAEAGGQPGNALAWHDAAADRAAGGFFRDTWNALDAAAVRPRHAGYLAFQHAAAERINAGLIGAESTDAVMADLNRMFTASFA